MLGSQNGTFAATVIALILCLFPLALLMPHHLSEDGPVETAGALGFLTAAIVAGIRGTIWPEPLQRTPRLMLIGVAAFSLLLFLSEVSFGSRKGLVSVPAMYGGGEFDGGHDIVILTLRLIRDGGWLAVALATALVLVLIGAVAHLLRARRRQFVMLVGRVLEEAFLFRLAFGLCLLAAAVLLDLLPFYKAGLLEEVLELVSSGVLLLVAFAPMPASPEVAAPRRTARPVSAPTQTSLKARAKLSLIGRKR